VDGGGSFVAVLAGTFHEEFIQSEPSGYFQFHLVNSHTNGNFIYPAYYTNFNTFMSHEKIRVNKN
jgi:hypothetical protein